MPVDEDTKTEEFHKKLMRLIDEGRADEAMDMFLDPELESQKMVLVHILTELGVSMRVALERSERSADDVIERSLNRAVERARDLYRALKGSFDHSDSLRHARALVGIIYRLLRHTRTLNDAREITEFLERQYAYAKFIASAIAFLLDVALDDDNIPDVFMEYFESSPDTLRFYRISNLTIPVLSTQLIPYLHALVDLQKIISELQRVEYAEPEIVTLTKGSANVELSNAGGAIESLKEFIFPWRRRHAQKMAELAVAEKEAEILDLRAKAALTRTETKKAEAEIEQKKVETETIRFDLQRSKFELAMSMADEYATEELSGEQRITYVEQILETLDILASGSIEPG
jgi:hypothetical protein